MSARLPAAMDRHGRTSSGVVTAAPRRFWHSLCESANNLAAHVQRVKRVYSSSASAVWWAAAGTPVEIDPEPGQVLGGGEVLSAGTLERPVVVGMFILR